MRKFIFTLLAIFLSVSLSYPQITTLWEKSAAQNTLPSWFDVTNSTRALSFGKGHVYIASRNGGNFIYIYDAANGDSLGLLDNTGISGGTYAISDVGVSSDGVIFVCNLTTNGSTSAFKVYSYATESSAPASVINYTSTSAARLGDKFTVEGSTADNSVVIWAASANTKELYKFTTADNGATFSGTVIDLPSLTGTSFGSASVSPISGGYFYYNATGQNVQKFQANGTVIDTVTSSIVGTGSNAIRDIGPIGADEYFATYSFGAGNENAKIVKMPGGDIKSAELVGSTTTLGTNSNTNGAGDVAITKVSEYVYNVYVLSCNNGFGAYQVDLSPQLSGTYYIGSVGTGPSGTDPDFASLNDAFNTINISNITGDCTFYITSDINEPNTGGIGIALAVDPSPYTITFKPYTGIQPTVTLAYPSDGNSGPSGAFVIGIPQTNNIAWNDLRTTKNIVFDGSNTNGGTTRDLTIQSAITAHRNAIPLVIVGDVSNVVFKNTNIFYKVQTVSTSGNLFIGAVMLRSRVNNSVDWVPSNITFENNYLSSNFDGVGQNAQGLGCYASSPYTVIHPNNITVKDNLIEGKRRGISLYQAGSFDIYGNEVILNQNIVANTTNEAVYAVTVDTGATINIYNNKISKVSSMSSGSGYGNAAISIETNGTYNIYNNMIYGFELTAANPTAYLRGISVNSSTAIVNADFNTINMVNIADIGTGSVSYNGFYVNNGTTTLNNNIVVDAEPDFAAYCIYRNGTNGTLTSNYNDFYAANVTNGNVGYFDTAAAQTLSDWQTASGQDANSVSEAVEFVSDTDLHLTGGSIGDVKLSGTPIAGITSDIDGDARDSQSPYMGADEGSVPLPVELISFKAVFISNHVELTWTTATEINNKGFEVQRKFTGSWEKIGFVNGNGTSTQRNSYSFIDNNVAGNNFSYRLKQINLNGTFTYSNIIEVSGVVPLKFNLSQNYPNPFNPTTTINYEIAVPTNVSLIVYNMLGQQVAVLINNQFTDAGLHSFQFNASKLASGSYVYRLIAGNHIFTKKMILLK